MGYVNLYAEIVTDAIENFLGDYKNGVLRPVMAIRLLEEREQPYASLKMGILDHDYIVFPIETPIEDRDVAWLYKRLIVENGDNFDRKSALDYSVERCLGTQYVGQRIKNPAKWGKVREFRRKLEVPAMALRQFQRSCESIEDHLLERNQHVVVIEYTGRRTPPIRRTTPHPAHA